MCLQCFGANKQISREYVLELLKYHNKKILFQNLLETEPIYRNDCQQGKTFEPKEIFKEVQCQDDFAMISDNLFTKLPLVLQQENFALMKKRRKVESITE